MYKTARSEKPYHNWQPNGCPIKSYLVFQNKNREIWAWTNILNLIFMDVLFNYWNILPNSYYYFQHRKNYWIPGSFYQLGHSKCLFRFKMLKHFYCLIQLLKLQQQKHICKKYCKWRMGIWILHLKTKTKSIFV